MNDEEYSLDLANGNRLAMSIQQQIGFLMFQERQRRGIKLTTLAALLDVSPEHIDRLETGRCKLQWSVLCKVLEYYHRKFEIKLIPDMVESEKEEKPTEEQA